MHLHDRRSVSVCLITLASVLVKKQNKIKSLENEKKDHEVVK